MKFSEQIWQKKSLDRLLHEAEGDNRLKRVLGPVGLTSLGVGAIIGTGIFVLIGKAAHDQAGPSVMLSFIVAGFACAMAGLCYAEFASMAPVAGSAYTYAYTTLGELLAWIIGWDLVLEYAVSSSAVAVGWSAYFNKLLGLVTEKLTGTAIHIPKIVSNAPLDYDPDLGKIVPTGDLINLPAMLITAIITTVLVVGIKESARFNNLMVAIKLAVVLFVIAVGSFYVNPDNWTPFAPYGYTGISFFGETVMGQADAGGKPLGMLSAAAIIFFAYIGFDSISTHAEEAKNPKRDVPIAILASLFVCTILYIGVAAVLTGMVSYKDIVIDAPVSAAFAGVGIKWAEFLIAFGALTGITSVLLVTMLSQPRVLLAMARDGLLPDSFFGAVHEKYRTPYKSTILTGCFVGLLSGFLPLRILSELVSIGTLMAFVIVCFAVLIMRKTNPNAERPFRAPLYPFVPIGGILTCGLLMFSLPSENWLRLIVWLGIGLVIYLIYGMRHSHIAKEVDTTGHA